MSVDKRAQFSSLYSTQPVYIRQASINHHLIFIKIALSSIEYQIILIKIFNVSAFWQVKGEKMKKAFIVLLVLLLPIFALSAQTGQIIPGSVESDRTYTLFNNALDAASNIDESVTDLAFSILGKDYLFAGIAGNPQEIANQGSSNSSLLLGYYKAAEKPWSVFTNISWTDALNQGPNAVDNGVDTTTKFNYKLFNIFNPRAQFLINIGDISTGLGVNLNLTDGKTVNAATNFESINSASGAKAINKTSNFSTVLNFFIPFYMETNNLSHYAALTMGINSLDLSTYNYVHNGTVVNTDNDIKNISTTFSPSVFYKLSMPTQKLGSFYASAGLGLGLLSSKDERIDKVVTANSYSRENSYTPGFNASLAAGLRMEQSTDGGWLRFRLNPEAQYRFETNPYEKGYVRGTTVVVDEKDLTMRNELTLTLISAMEVLPEKWIIGFMLGAQGRLGYANSTRTQNPGKAPNATNDGATSKTVNNIWISEANANFGVFIPLPNGCRFDIAVNSGQNLLVPANLTMQLIVPLGKTNAF